MPVVAFITTILSHHISRNDTFTLQIYILYKLLRHCDIQVSLCLIIVLVCSFYHYLGNLQAFYLYKSQVPYPRHFQNLLDFYLFFFFFLFINHAYKETFTFLYNNFGNESLPWQIVVATNGLRNTYVYNVIATTKVNCTDDYSYNLVFYVRKVMEKQKNIFEINHPPYFFLSPEISFHCITSINITIIFLR